MRARVAALFVEREVILRSAGHVRFIRISRSLQQRMAIGAAVLLLVWAGVTAAMLVDRALGARDRAAIDRSRAAVAREAAALSAYRARAGDSVEKLQRRQALIEQLVRDRLGDPEPAATPTAAAKTSAAALPDTRALAAAQDALALRLAAAFDRRSAALSAQMRGLGLRADAPAQGGPLLPWPARGEEATAPIARLAMAAGRWAALRDNLVAVPSGKPTAGLAVASSYGVRGDPFTGRPALHAGLDFTGGYGQPILAAAPGRVTFVGQRAGYGNVVEIDHGHALATRYAHLSGFDVRPGARVARGQQIARMGSTGRSTGTHLHFEVRVAGAAMDPRRFLRKDTSDVR